VARNESFDQSQPPRIPIHSDTKPEEGRITYCNKAVVHYGHGEMGLPFAVAAAKTQF